MVSRYDPGSACYTTRTSPAVAVSVLAPFPLRTKRIERGYVPDTAFRNLTCEEGNAGAGVATDMTTTLLHHGALRQAA